MLFLSLNPLQHHETLYLYGICNSYAMVCPSVLRDKPRALASGFIPYRWINVV